MILDLTLLLVITLKIIIASLRRFFNRFIAFYLGLNVAKIYLYIIIDSTSCSYHVDIIQFLDLTFWKPVYLTH
jgi:hypothetical protein